MPISFMAVEARTTWGSSHTTFRLFPEPLGHLGPMLAADGKTPDEVLATLPFDSSRSKNAGSTPDPRRYRDYRQVYRWRACYSRESVIVHVTDLGRATQRWVGKLTPKNLLILGRHAAYALSACQLRKSLFKRPFDPSMYVFPFAFIWRAMLNWTIESVRTNSTEHCSRSAKNLNSVGIKSIADARSAKRLGADG